VVADADLPEQFKIGSIGGGGRYDNLTSIFGLNDVSGVGVSFGLDRICDTLEVCNKFPDFTDLGGVIICCMDEEALQSGAEIARNLRASNISVELYPSAVKLKKQLDYANQKGLHHAVILGSREIESKTASVKNLKTGEQVSANWADIQNFIK
jgi:histidyl-tRNA synthetase